MDKKQFEAKKAIIDKHIRLIDALMADIEKEFAETQKPKLRHGDIRQWGCSDGCVGIVDLSEPAPHMLWPGDDLRNSKTQDVILSRSKSIGNLKDIFDDLKAMQEDLMYFKTDVHDYRIDSKQYPDAPIYMAGNHHSVAEVEEHIRNLLRLLATYKRGQNDS